MKQLAWGDTLLGRAVTPGAWDGGLICRDGRWVVQRPAPDYVPAEQVAKRMAQLPDVYGHEGVTPIFPPRGWAGKSDKALWKKLVGFDNFDSLNPGCKRGEYHEMKRYDIDAGVEVTQEGGICVYVADNESDVELSPAGVTALILALQNAAVLAARLAPDTAAKEHGDGS